MSKAFNFYQGITGLIYPQGAPTPFGLFYIDASGLSGVYFPLDIALGAPLHLLNDGDTFPTNLKIKESGNVDKELKDILPYSIGVSGDAFPAAPEDGELAFYISGNVTGNTPDNVFFSIPWIANLTGCPLDIYNLFIKQVGNVAVCTPDNFLFNLGISGDFNNPPPETNNFSLSIKGDLIGGQSDIENIIFKMYNISFAPGLETISINTGDLGSISFIMNTISFKRAE